MQTLANLVASHSIVNPAASLALGVPVTLILDREGTRHPLGVVVAVAESQQGVWVRRFDDTPDVSVWYSVNELEIATTADLVSIARMLLGRQYHESVVLAAQGARW